MASIWIFFIKFRWHDEKLTLGSIQIVEMSLFFRLKSQIFQQRRHLAIFFISFKIKPNVTSIYFTIKNRIFTPFWYQNCKNCKVVPPMKIWIWLEYSWNLLMCVVFIVRTLKIRLIHILWSNITKDAAICLSICLSGPLCDVTFCSGPSECQLNQLWLSTIYFQNGRPESSRDNYHQSQPKKLSL